MIKTPNELKAGIGKKGEVWFETAFPMNGKIWVPQTVRDFISSGEAIRVTIKKRKKEKKQNAVNQREDERIGGEK